MSFDKIETAARAREIIKRVTTQQVKSVVPKAMVGRMMSVDLPRLRGTVWLPGDDQPIEVSIFANAVPSEWQHKRTELEGAESSTTGWGAVVVVERLNGTLYVTHVLTGGTAALDFRSLGVSLLAQQGADVQAAGPTGDAIVDIAGPPHETFINCRITNTSLAKGEAMEFGPFTRYDTGTPEMGFMELTVRFGHCIKSYRFLANPEKEFDNETLTHFNIWYRILPEQTIQDTHNIDTSSFDDTYSDFDLDICFRRTDYGNTTAFRGYRELWFRIVKRTTQPTDGIDAFVSLRGTNIQKGRSLGGRELFMQERKTSPIEIFGYLGFHGANHYFAPDDSTWAYDTFDRVTTSGMGSGGTMLSWEINQAASQYSIDGNRARITPNNPTQYFEARIPFDFPATFIDGYVTVSTNAIAVGAAGVAGMLIQHDTVTGNKYMIGLQFEPAGVVYTIMYKIISGVTSIVHQQVLSGGYTANQKFYLRVQHELRSTSIPYNYYRIKAWRENEKEPRAWHWEINAAYQIGAGRNGIFAFNSAGTSISYDFHEMSILHQDPAQIGWGDARGTHSGPFRASHLRVANDLQKTWTYEGQFEWDGTYLKLPTTIYLEGIGADRYGLLNGRAYLSVPAYPAGTTYNLKYVPQDSGDPGYITVNVNNGIPLGVGESLWVAIPPGIPNDNLFFYMFIVDSTSLKSYQLPEWAVMIATRGQASASPEIRLGNGEILDKWRSVTFTTNWSNWGAPFENIGYRKITPNTVVLKGLMKHTTSTATGTAFTLPVGFRPKNGRLFNIPAGTGLTGFARADLAAAGTFSVSGYASGGGSSYVSLEGVFFNTD